MTPVVQNLKNVAKILRLMDGDYELEAQAVEDGIAALDAQEEGATVWIGRMGSAEEMIGRFCTIGKFDPADRHWAFHYHSSKDAAQTFAKSMTEHGSPAIAIEVVEYYAPPPQTEPRRK